MGKKKDEEGASFRETIAWLGGNMEQADAMESHFRSAFPTEGIPDGAVQQYIDRVFVGDTLRQSVAKLVSEHFTPAVPEVLETISAETGKG